MATVLKPKRHAYLQARMAYQEKVVVEQSLVNQGDHRVTFEARMKAYENIVITASEALVALVEAKLAGEL